MNTIIASSEQEVTEKLAALGIDAGIQPTTHEYTISHGERVAHVIRTDISEYWGIDLDLNDPSGDVLWMVEGVDREDVPDAREYVESYIDVMRDDEERAVAQYEWDAIRQSFDYHDAIRQIEAWKARQE